MSKRSKTEEAEGGSDDQATSGTGGGRSIVLTLEDGTEEKRADYIRRRADEGATRTEIAKELTALQGKEVPYQIVFAATKGHPAYPKRSAGATNDAEDAEDADEVAA